MKTILTIIAMLIASKTMANDSTARVQMNKAKTNAILSLTSTFIGSVMVYKGIVDYNPQTTNAGVLLCGVGAILGTVATYQYYNAQIEARLGYKSVGVRIRF